MGFDTMTEIQKRGGRFWGVTYLAELFEAPIPEYDSEGNQISSWSDLFRTSPLDEFFIPSSQEVSFCFTDDETSRTVSSEEFVAWQVKNASPLTLYYIINKVDGHSILRDLYPDEEHLEWNGITLDDGWVSEAEELWLSEYDADSITKGLNVLKLCQSEKSEEFSTSLAKYILDEQFGLGCEEYFEADLSEDFSNKESYENWSVQIMCVAKGRMFPYLEAGNSHLIMDDYKVFYYGVRNYDED